VGGIGVGRARKMSQRQRDGGFVHSTRCFAKNRQPAKQPLEAKFGDIFPLTILRLGVVWYCSAEPHLFSC
jgi:hypothetical protein